MYYLVVGKVGLAVEDKIIADNTFNYYFDGSFTQDELTLKSREYYAAEYNKEVTENAEKNELMKSDSVNFSFISIYQSETSITKWE